MPPFLYSLVVRILARSIFVASAVLAPSIAHSQSALDELELTTAKKAYLSGNFSEAIHLLERSIARDDRNPEAHYWIAQAWLAEGDPIEARKSIRRARSLDNESLKFAVAELEILREATPRESSISLTDGRRLALAEQVLNEDRHNAAALEEMGLHHAMSYRWHANFDATKQPLGNSIRRKADEEFDAARGFLARSVASDPTRLSAYGELLRLLIEEGEWTDAASVARTAVDAMSDQPEPWLFAGLVAQLQSQSELAEPYFRQALDRMDDRAREAFEEVTLFTRSVEEAVPGADPERFWSERDPFLMTSVNERQMDHFARLAYAELWYGGRGLNGWETERGRIVVRYGIPWSDAQFIGGYSRFNVLEYRDFEFVFEDQTRGGHFTMYSPKASASSSWSNDFVIQAGEMARSNPEQFDPKHLTSVDLMVETSSFRGEHGGTDVYVHVRAPYPPADSSGYLAGTVGAFALDATGAQRRRSSIYVTPRYDEQTGAWPPATLALEGLDGSEEIRIEFLSDDRTAAGRLAMEADWPLFSEDSLALSDILPARIVEPASESSPNDGTRIVRSGYAIEPRPWTSLGVQSDLLVYFEIYGLAQTTDGSGSYRIDAVLEPSERKSGVGGFLSRLLGASEPAVVTASVESRSAGSDEAGFISVALPNDASGRYRFRIDVLDLISGQEASRSRIVSVDAGRGQ